MPGTERTGMMHGLTHRQQNIATACHVGRIATDHDGQARRPGPFDATGDRGIEQADIVRRQNGAEFAGTEGIGGTHIDDNRTDL